MKEQDERKKKQKRQKQEEGDKVKAKKTKEIWEEVYVKGIEEKKFMTSL